MKKRRNKRIPKAASPNPKAPASIAPDPRPPCPDHPRLLHLNSTCQHVVQDLIDHLPLMICIKDRSLRLIACNSAYSELYGRKTREILGCTDFDYRDEADARKSQMEDERALRFDQPTESVEGTLREGRERWHRVIRTPFRDPSGSVAGLVTSFQDITTERREARNHYESGERFRHIVENMPDGLIIHDLKGRILEVNDQLTRLTGYPREALLAMNLGRQGHEEETREILARLAKGGQVVFETPITRQDGRRITLSISTKLVSREGDGRAQAFVRDVTDLRIVEEAVRRSTDRFRNVVESSPMGIHMYRLEEDDRLVFTGANGAANRILGVDNRLFIGKTIEEAFPALVGTEVPARYRRACSHGESWHTNQVTYEDDRIRGAFDVYAFPTGPGEMAVLFLDITDRLKNEEETRRLAAAVEQTTDAIIIISPQGNIRYVNHAFERITGYSREQILRRNTDNIHIPDEVRLKLPAIKKAIENGESWSGPFASTRHGSHDTYSVELTLSPVHDASGRLTDVIAVIRDISDRIRNAEQLQRLAAAIEQVDQAVFITDFDRNLLYANPAFETVTGYRVSEMLGKKPDLLLPSDNAPELIEEMVDTVQRRGQTWRGRLVNIRKDGSRFVSDSFLANIRDSQGRPVSVMAIVRDITAQVERESQIQRLATAVDQVADGIMILDPQTRILYANKAFERITGYASAEILGRIPSFLGPDEAATRAYFEAHVLPKVHETGSWRIQQTLIRKDGSRTVIESSLSGVYDREGRLINFVSSIRDISEQLKQEEAVRRLAAAVDQVDESVFITDPDRIIQYVNPSFERTTGYTRAEAIGRTPEFLVPPEVAADVFRDMSRKVLGGGSWSGRFLNVRKDGSLFTAEATVSTVKNADGVPTNAITIMRDITEQLRVEEEMLRLATAFNQTSEPTLILDMEGNIQFVNPAFTRVTGYAREEALGRTPAFLIAPGEDPSFFDQVGRTVQEGRIWSGRTRNLRKDQTLLEIEATVSPVLDPSGRLINMITLLRDVTEQTALQDRLQQAQKMEAIGQLAGGVAHDFNNLLAPILGYVQMLLMKLPPDDPCRPDLKEIEKAAYRGRDLSRQLLTFSRKQVVEMRPVTMLEVLEGFQRILRRTLREDIDLHLYPRAAGRILADTAQLELVLMNLALNAQDAMPRGGALVVETEDVVLDESFVQRHPGSRTGPHVLLSVSDTGVGISPEQQKHIFEPFYTTKDKEKGTGLGLATVYGIVRQHNALIDVYSEVGRGTTFKIHFPVTEEPASGAAMAPTELAAASAMRGHETVMVVEDEEAVRSMVVSALERFGYSVVVPKNPEEALKMAATLRPLHLLLTDVVMPEMNGRDLHRQLSRLIPGLRVVFMSGYTQNIIAHHGMLDAGVRLLQKPFTLETLARKVREALDAPPSAANEK